jgi:hypothetical protein
MLYKTSKKHDIELTEEELGKVSGGTVKFKFTTTTKDKVETYFWKWALPLLTEEISLCASTFALARPRRAIKYTMASPAGRLKFSNPAARGIVSALSAGPASLAEIIAKSALPGQDVLANLLVLCAAGAVWPVEQRRTSVSALNEAIRRHLGGPDELLYLALPCGTALAVDDVLLRLLRGGRQAGVGKHGDWQEFLCSHGLPKHVRHARGGQRSNRHDSGAHHT